MIVAEPAGKDAVRVMADLRAIASPVPTRTEQSDGQLSFGLGWVAVDILMGNRAAFGCA